MSRNDIYRYVLLILLGVCGYLLIQAWVSDSERRNTPGVATPSTPQVSNPTNQGSDTPTTESFGDESIPNEVSPSSSSSDIPDDSLIPPRQDELAIASQANSRDLIQVKTPVLQVWIDPTGGDIVGAKLPSYPISLKQADTPTTLLDRNLGREYIAQSGLIGEHGFDRANSRPVYSVEKPEWTLVNGTLEVPLMYEEDGVSVTKTFVFRDSGHDVDVVFEVVNNRDADFSANLFAQLKRDGLQPPDQQTGFLRPRAYLGAAVSTNEVRYKKLKFNDINKSNFQEIVNGGWIAILQHYFLTAWIPESQNTYRYYGNRDPSGMYRFGFTGPTTIVEAGGSGTYQAKLYIGPKHQRTLVALAPHLDLTVDYGFFWWLSIPLFKALQWIQSWVVNWGVAIILLTIVIKTVLFPLSAMSYRSMAKMRKLAPQIKRLQERFGTDRQKLGQEMMALYSKEKANPLSGCLPLLLQMPVFFALYWVLIESVELRQAPFFLWIQDLGAMDPWLVFPILNGLSMFLMQRLNPPMADPMQQKVMMFMPIIFAGICIFMPAGLVLYWLTNNLYSMAHHYYALKQAGAT